MTKIKIFKFLTIFITFLWLSIFALMPSILILITSFLTYEDTNFIKFTFTLNNYAEIFNTTYATIYYNSIRTALITTVTTLLLGYPFAYIIAHINNKFTKTLLLILTIIPLWTSSLIRTYAIIVIFKFNGLLNKLLLFLGIINHPLNLLYNNFAIIFGLIYTLIPFMIFPLYIALEKIDNEYIEAAFDLGASKLNIFFRIILPMSYNGIISGCTFVFISSLGMFYIADILGGAKNTMLGNIIKDQFLIARNWPLGSVVCITLLIFMGLCMLLINRRTKTIT